MSTSSISATTFPPELYTITIVIYAIFLIPTIFIWRKHGGPGFLCYNYIYGFCAVRIAGSVLSLAAIPNPSLLTPATIVNSMAISPLILAALGMLHEARRARVARLEGRREWLLVGGFHAVVTVAIVLVILGIVDVTKGGNNMQESGLVKSGLAVLVICFVGLVFWTAVSMRVPREAKQATFTDGTIVSPAYPFPINFARRSCLTPAQLISALIFALPFIGVRLVYGILSFLLSSPSFSQSLAVKIVFCSFPEVLATALFVFGGWRTRGMYCHAVMREKAMIGEYTVL